MWSWLLPKVAQVVFPPTPGQDPEAPLPMAAVPGITTVLDVALLDSVQGQLTATICSSHAFLQAWLDVQEQARSILKQGQVEDEQLQTLHPHSSRRRRVALSFARQCLEASYDMMERCTVDRLSHSANLTHRTTSASSAHTGPPPLSASATAANHHPGILGGTGSSSSHHHHHSSSSPSLSGVGWQGIASGVRQGKYETGRCTYFFNPILYPRDCWESPRLHCPDYVWAEEIVTTGQRWVKQVLAKHAFLSEDPSEAALLDPTTTHTGLGRSAAPHRNALTAAPMSSELERKCQILAQLVLEDLPTRWWQCKLALEADSVVTKRLYLVKCELRAPLRAFWEGHQSVQKAPSLELVQAYLKSQSSTKQSTSSNSTDLLTVDQVKTKLQSLFQTPWLQKVLVWEQQAEQVEGDIAKALFPFCELARFLEAKDAQVVTTGSNPLVPLRLARLKFLLCRKGGGPEASSGIRPLLLDLQGVPRDEDPSQQSVPQPSKHIYIDHVQSLMQDLQALKQLCASHASHKAHRRSNSLELIPAPSSHGTNSGSNKQGRSIEIPSSISKACQALDVPLLEAHLEDWFDLVQLVWTELQSQEDSFLAQEIRQAELQLSIAAASPSQLETIAQRLEQLQSDRQKRFQVAQQMVGEVCAREMNLYVQLQDPPADKALELKSTPSAVGFLGLPLLQRGASLPIG